MTTARATTRFRLLAWPAVVGLLALAAGGCGAAPREREGRSAPRSYERRRPPRGVDAVRERVLALAALRPGMRVAEIGIGGGWFVSRASEAVGAEGLVYGTDIDPRAVDALRRSLENVQRVGSPVELRVCRGERDTALDDLPPGSVDVVFMVDSLCFDDAASRAEDVAYLARFARLLAPGGRLLHHMDCQCDADVDALVATLVDAGFAPDVARETVPDALLDQEARCAGAERAPRGRLVLIAHTRAGGEPATSP